MRRKLIIDGNAVYEIDDECICSNEGQKTLTGSVEKISRIMKDVSERHVGQSDMVKSENGCVSERDKNIRIC